jgi:hypothetical protein
VLSCSLQLKRIRSIGISGDGRVTVSDSALELPAQQVEELVRTIVKAQRAFQMYLPNNPIYQRSIDALRAAFNPIWSGVPTLTLTVVETELLWGNDVVYHHPIRSDSFAWMLYKDGLRQLTLHPGVEEEEIVRFLQTVVRARLLAADAGDDLLTLLWEHDFRRLEYRFAEIITDTLAVLDPQAIDLTAGPDPFRQAENQQKIRQELGSFTAGMADLEEFDSTLYFLDEAEIASLKQQVEDEYQRDVRTASLAVVLDVFELQPTTAIREEVIGILEAVFPNLLTRGEFRLVAWLLRELRTIGNRVALIDGAVRTKLDSFESRLSEPGILAQMLQVVDEAIGLVKDEDLAELLKELRPAALEPLLTHLAKVRNERVHGILEGAAERIARGHGGELLRILRDRGSAALVGAIRLSRRVVLQQALPSLGDLLGHSDATVRVAAVETLAALGTPGAIGLLERALDDTDRAVRLAAVDAVAARGYKGALKRLEAVVQGRGPHDLERAEKRHFFEAYAAVAGSNALALLSEILESRGLFRRRESSETRTCAAYAIARIRSEDARRALERATQDKELSVRNAATRALREWEG